MLDLVAACLDSMSPEDVPLSYVAKWAEASTKLAMPVGDDAEGRKELRVEEERIELVIRDPEARRLALELDERMGELESSWAPRDECSSRFSTSTKDYRCAVQRARVRP